MLDFGVPGTEATFKSYVRVDQIHALSFVDFVWAKGGDVLWCLICDGRDQSSIAESPVEDGLSLILQSFRGSLPSGYSG